MFVAAISSLPVLLLSDLYAQETNGDVPALLIGVMGWLIAWKTGRSRVSAVFYGVTAMALGVLVALVKTRLAAH